MSGEPADPYVASRETPPPREPRRRADRQRFLNRFTSEAWTRWHG
ncbi:hypothetical protein GCM10010306_067070 [Streptomyces umbrinus]|nr:hypothetical protein GCM10010306_067070 [Streptomyces umbrinus]